VSSIGHRDGGSVDVVGGGPSEAASGDGVDAVFDVLELAGCVGVEVGGFADVAADEGIAVFVGGALPGRVGISDVNVDAAVLGDLLVAGDLRALVPGQGRSQSWWEALESPAERGVGVG
jgi:hypothetical protein